MNDCECIDILIVEDSPCDAELTIRALKKENSLCKYYWVEDGEAALDFIFCKGKYENRNFSNKPKAILLDMKLPKINGLEVLKTLKCNSNTSSIPIITVTSSQEDVDVKSAYELGVNSYIVKPIDYNFYKSVIGDTCRYWLSINKTLV
jgi:two-component system response regulator